MPAIRMPMKVNRMLRGMDSPITKVARRSLRNRKMTRIDINTPMIPARATVISEELTLRLSSLMMV